MSSLIKFILKQLDNSMFYRHLLFGILTAFTICYIGYYFGTFDQAIHIPFLKKMVDPSLYPHDPFFDMRFTHYSYFWVLFQPLYRLGILEISMFFVYGGMIYLTFWAFWRLSWTLFRNTLTSFLSVITFAFVHVGFGGFPVFEFSLLNRTFVLPFILLALDLHLRKHTLFSFVILGFMYNIHVISINFALAMVLFDCLVRWRKVGVTTIVGGMGLFVVTALPVLAWKFGTSHLDIAIHREWFAIINYGLLYHLFNLISLNFQVMLLVACGVSTLIIFFLTKDTSDYTHIVTNFIIAATLIVIVQEIATLWYPATIIIQSQIIRAGLYILIFSYLYSANYIVKRFRKYEITKTDFFIQTIALILSALPFVWLFVILLYKKVKNVTLVRVLSIAITVITFIGVSYVTWQQNIWQPGIHIFAQKSAWYDVQVWARTNTSKDTIFITPPYKWWFFDHEWRVVSERSTVSTLSELLEAAFSPEYIPYWQERFESVAPGALAQFKGNTFDTIQITKKAYYSLQEEDIRGIAQKYHATYFVVEKPHVYQFPIAFENVEFVVYRVL